VPSRSRNCPTDRRADVLREQGITIRRQGLADEQVSEAAELYSAGKSLAWIGARFGVSHTTIATALRRQEIHLRPRPGWGGRGSNPRPTDLRAVVVVRSRWLPKLLACSSIGDLTRINDNG
jgi:hypothetical protein